jgi:uncharacterized protein (DUF608 family)
MDFIEKPTRPTRWGPKWKEELAKSNGGRPRLTPQQEEYFKQVSLKQRKLREAMEKQREEEIERHHIKCIKKLRANPRPTARYNASQDVNHILDKYNYDEMLADLDQVKRKERDELRKANMASETRRIQGKISYHRNCIRSLKQALMNVAKYPTHNVAASDEEYDDDIE